MARVTIEQKQDLECLYLFHRYAKFVHEHSFSIARLTKIFARESQTEKALMNVVASMTVIAIEQNKADE